MRSIRMIVAGGALALASIHPAGAAVEHPVSIQGFAYAPETVNIVVGDTVRWTNNDFVAHNVAAGNGYFSGNFSSGSRAHTFTTPGTFDYFCTLHPSMTGTVVVADVPAPVIPEGRLAAATAAVLAALGVGRWLQVRRRGTTTAA